MANKVYRMFLRSMIRLCMHTASVFGRLLERAEGYRGFGGPVIRGRQISVEKDTTRHERSSVRS